MKDTVLLTASEWNVMECLWAKSPMTVMELVAALDQKILWAKSTTITTLRRMETKGIIAAEPAGQGRGKQYRPCVDRNSAVRAETRSFLDRVYQGSVGLMVSAMAKEKALSRDEIEELYQILREAEEAQK